MKANDLKNALDALRTVANDLERIDPAKLPVLITAKSLIAIESARSSLAKALSAARDARPSAATEGEGK